MKTPKFKIGDWVEIRAKVYLEYDANNDRQVKKIPMTRVGQICGAKRKMLGKYKHGNSTGSGYFQEYEPAWLEVKGSIIVWLVRTGYINKPIEVLEEDIILMYSPVRFVESYSEIYDKKLPWFDTGWTEFTKKQQKQMMEGTMDDAPRDSKGRWI